MEQAGGTCDQNRAVHLSTDDKAGVEILEHRLKGVPMTSAN
jgi:hypothetical protein